MVWRGLGGGGGFPTCFFLLPHEHVCGMFMGRWEHSGRRCEVGGFGEQGVCMPEKWWVRCICMCWEGGWGVFGAGRPGSLQEAIAMYTSLTYTQVCLYMLRAHTCPRAQHESLQELRFPGGNSPVGVRDNPLARELSREGLGSPVSIARAGPDCNPCIAHVQATPTPAPLCLWALPFVSLPVPTAPVIPVHPGTPAPHACSCTCTQMLSLSPNPTFSHTSPIPQGPTGPFPPPPPQLPVALSSP